MRSSPQRPCDDMGGLDALGKTRGDRSDLLDRPADQRRVLGVVRRIILFGGGAAMAWGG